MKSDRLVIAVILALLVASPVACLLLADPTRSTTAYLVRSLVLGQRVEEMIPHDTAVAELELLLGHPEIPIHVVAANRLLELRSSDPFLRALKGADSSAHSVSAHWLQNFPDEPVREALRKALLDEDESRADVVRLFLGEDRDRVGLRAPGDAEAIGDFDGRERDRRGLVGDRAQAGAARDQR